MKKTLRFFSAALFAAAFALTARADEPKAAPAYDAKLTNLARLLAGQTPDAGSFDKITASDMWKKHQAFFAERWPKIESGRFKTAAAWRDTEIRVPAEAAATLAYPFSGPDFLNAQLFFPSYRQYIFYSLEAPGVIPDVETMSDANAAAYFGEIQEALDDIFMRHYFITNHMFKELTAKHLKGNKPLFFIFMALMKDKIVSAEEVSLNEAGEVIPMVKPAAKGGKKPAKGLKITFLRDGAETPQTLVYFSLDVSDTAILRHPEFLKFLAKNAPAAAFIKSASYLLQDPQFKTIRKTILDTSAYLMQDDSGMPYRSLKKDWDVTLYGDYLGPKKDFKVGFQADLDKAYKVAGAAKPLPFHFGYHWEEGRESCVQIAVKKPVAPAAK